MHVKTLATGLAASVVLTLTACGTSGLDGYVDDLATRLEALSAASDAHETRLDACPDLAAMHDEERRHHDELTPELEAMHHVADDMGTCGWHGDGMAGSHMGDLAGEVVGTHEAFEAHHQAMLAAPDEAAARAEEARWQAWLDERLSQMQGHCTSLRETEGWSCPMHEGDHMQSGGHMGDGPMSGR